MIEETDSELLDGLEALLVHSDILITKDGNNTVLRLIQRPWSGIHFSEPYTLREAIQSSL